MRASQEVLRLMRHGFTKDSPSARAIGYRESIDYLTEARVRHRHFLARRWATHRHYIVLRCAARGAVRH